MEAKEFAGLLLIVAGIVFIYLMQLGYLKARRKAVGTEGFDPGKAIEEIIKKLPTRMVPGAFMILVGAWLLTADGGKGKPEPAPSPTAIHGTASLVADTGPTS